MLDGYITCLSSINMYKQVYTSINNARWIHYVPVKRSVDLLLSGDKGGMDKSSIEKSGASRGGKQQPEEHSGLL